MSCSLSKTTTLHYSSPLKIIEEYPHNTEKPGIVTILGSDVGRMDYSVNSLRRTLSADMSSKKWLAQNGLLSPMKKVASANQISASIQDYDERKEGEDIWSSIQKRKEDDEKLGEFDVWSSIVSQKAKEIENSLPPPYIHPLVKRSSSSLSEKSLEICTESLGSETGSDGFSSYPSSETGEIEEEEEKEQDQQEQQEQVEESVRPFDRDEWMPVKYNYKKSPPRSFPPPLPSLTPRDGASMRIESRRDNGRLVLEAMSVPSQNNFTAQRQDGRLVLTFVSPTHHEEGNEEENKFEEESEVKKGPKIEEEAMGIESGQFVGTKDMEFVKSGMISVHRLALMVSKPIGLAKRYPPRPNMFNEVVQFSVDEEKEFFKPNPIPPHPKIARLLSPPPAPPAAAAAATVTAAESLNAYEYYWRSKPTVKTVKLSNPISQQPPTFKKNSNKLMLSKNSRTNEQTQLLVLRGNKGDYLVPLSKLCKEPRRSLLFRDPYCIATS